MRAAFNILHWCARDGRGAEIYKYILLVNVFFVLPMGINIWWCMPFYRKKIMFAAQDIYFWWYDRVAPLTLIQLVDTNLSTVMPILRWIIATEPGVPGYIGQYKHRISQTRVFSWKIPDQIIKRIHHLSITADTNQDCTSMTIQFPTLNVLNQLRS